MHTCTSDANVRVSSLRCCCPFFFFLLYKQVFLQKPQSTMSAFADQVCADLSTLRSFIAAQHFQTAAAADEGDAADVNPTGIKVQTLQYSSPADTSRKRNTLNELTSKNKCSIDFSLSPPSCAEASRAVLNQTQQPIKAASDAALTSSVEQPQQQQQQLWQLHEELKVVTADLHTERAAVAQLRLQHRCSEAALQQLAQQAEDAQALLTQALTERDDWEKRCRAAENGNASYAEHLKCVRLQVDAIQKQVCDAAKEQQRLRAAAQELSDVVQELTHRNTRLHDRVRRNTAELLRLSSVETELHTAQQRIHGFEAEYEAWWSELRGVRDYFHSIKREYVEGMELITSLQRERETLAAALAQSEAQCSQWELLFQRNPPVPSASTDARALNAGASSNDEAEVEAEAAKTSITGASACVETPQKTPSDTKEAEEENNEEENETRSPSLSTGAHTWHDASHAVFTQQLEAKVADLAMQLYAAQARATRAEQHVQRLAQLHLTDSAVLLELKAILCVLRPQTEVLACNNAELQTRLLAAEGMVEPLMEHVLRLADAYTEEACRQAQQQQHLSSTKQGDAEQGVYNAHSRGSDYEDSSTSNSNARVPDAVADNAGNCDSQTFTASAASDMHEKVRHAVLGKRHRLRTTALLSRHME